MELNEIQIQTLELSSRTLLPYMPQIVANMFNILFTDRPDLIPLFNHDTFNSGFQAIHPPDAAACTRTSSNSSPSPSSFRTARLVAQHGSMLADVFSRMFIASALTARDLGRMAREIDKIAAKHQSRQVPRDAFPAMREAFLQSIKAFIDRHKEGAQNQPVEEEEEEEEKKKKKRGKEMIMDQEMVQAGVRADHEQELGKDVQVQREKNRIKLRQRKEATQAALLILGQLETQVLDAWRLAFDKISTSFIQAQEKFLHQVQQRQGELFWHGFRDFSVVDIIESLEEDGNSSGSEAEDESNYKRERSSYSKKSLNSSSVDDETDTDNPPSDGSQNVVVIKLVLTPVDQRPIPDFRFGQYVCVRVVDPSNPRNVMIRNYVLGGGENMGNLDHILNNNNNNNDSNDANKAIGIDKSLPTRIPSYTVIMKDEVSFSTLTNYVRNQLQVGDIVQLSPPLGTFLLLENM